MNLFVYISLNLKQIIMHYLVTIGYETEQMDRNGSPRLQKLKYILEAETVEEATIVAAKYRSGDVRGSESIAVAKMQIECIIDRKNTPEYYK